MSEDSRKSVLSTIHERNKEIHEQFHQILSDLQWNIADLQRDHHRPKAGANKKRPAQAIPEAHLSPDLRSTREKLVDYESAIRQLQIHQNKTEVNVQQLMSEHEFGASASAANEREQSFADIMKQKRDQKRRRAKYRTSKAPITYTEEIRQLIAMQGEAWTQCLSEQSKSTKRYKHP